MPAPPRQTAAPAPSSRAGAPGRAAYGSITLPRARPAPRAHVAGVASSAPRGSPRAGGRAAERRAEDREKAGGRAENGRDRGEPEPEAPVAELPAEAGQVAVPDEELPARGGEQRQRQEERDASAPPVPRPERHHPDAAQRGQRRSHRDAIVGVEDAARVAVDPRVGERPARPEERRLGGGAERPAARGPRGAGRDAGERERQEPAHLPRQVAIGQAQWADR